jgi:hypothetical protein
MHYDVMRYDNFDCSDMRDAIFIFSHDKRASLRFEAMDSRQSPYLFARDSWLCMREALIEHSNDGAAAEEWVKSFSKALARRVPIHI